MNKLYEEIKLKREAKKEEFLKKKNPEKIKILYEKIEEINSFVADLESREECSWESSKNTEWINKIKYEQESFLERIEDLESEFADFKEKILEIDFIKSFLELKKGLEKYEKEERTKKFFEKLEK